ncbi:ParB/RepB/Spo0J family partition protein [Kaarinaea lacus]
MSVKKRGLGKGLDALLSGSAIAVEEESTGGADLRELPVDLLQPGKYQPRTDMHPESLEELASSIRAQGVVQPIVVRSINASGRFEIIAGERRWRAAQMAGLHEIPAVVRNVPDEAAIAMALIENIQRENLNPIEEAIALQRLINEFEMTHQEAAGAVGRSRAAVSNLLRLLTLNDDVRKLVEQGDLEMGHARALLALEGENQSHTAREVAAKGYSVRETEHLVRRLNTSPARPKKPPRTLDPDIRRLQDDIMDKLAARVELQHSARGSGKMVIHYNSLDELDGILKHIQ